VDGDVALTAPCDQMGGLVLEKYFFILYIEKN